MTDAKTIAAEFKDYAYRVSHDLSGPVRSMVEFSKLLKNEKHAALSEESEEYLSLIIENGKKLQQMMDGLLDYSRLNTMNKSFSVIDSNRLLQDCQKTLKDRISTSKAKLEIQPLPNIQGDADQVLQLFMVLLDNSIKFCSAQQAPVIKISATPHAEEVEFSVTDNGIGIEPEFHEQIFKLFRRLHSDDEYAGVGVGLTLAEKIVHRHGGRIWCNSEPRKGTTISFTLPMARN